MTAPNLQDYRPAGSTGAQILDDVQTFLARFVAYPSDACLVAATLWVAHAHAVDRFESTPRLAHLSPEPGSGKSRSLEVIETLVPRPIHAVNATSAALFRSVADEAGPPTILFDEIDTLFGPKAKENEDIRGMLNAGHRRGATSLRCVVRGKSIDLVEFPAFCAVALAGLGDMPDTLMTRSVIIRMRRRAPHEHVEPFRHRLNAPEGHRLRDRLAEWLEQVGDDLEAAFPDMPEGINDRPADVWEPLLAVADAAGGRWPECSRVAAVALVTQAAERPATLGVRLLDDLRTTFTSLRVQAITTATAVEKLVEMEESPWADLRGKPLDARGLARRLRPYDVKPKNVRIGDVVAKGYALEDLHDAFERYLPALEGSPRSPESSVTSATSATSEEPGSEAEPTHCSLCNADLLLRRAGRDTCERCRLAARSA